jgi:Rieske Fe-S protein
MTTPNEPAGSSPAEMTRRKFIVWWMTGLLAAFAAVVITPLIIFIWPNASGRVKHVKVKVTLQTGLSQIDPSSPVQFYAPSGLALEMQTGGGDNSPGKASYGGFVCNVTHAGGPGGPAAWDGYQQEVDGNTIVAYSITCPHLGCNYAWQSALNQFVCPCHGSHFYLNGNVEHGPAEAPLAVYQFTHGGNDKEIVIAGYQIIGAG